MSRSSPYASDKEAVAEHIRENLIGHMTFLEEAFNCEISDKLDIELKGSEQFYKECLSNIVRHMEEEMEDRFEKEAIPAFHMPKQELGIHEQEKTN